MPTYWIGGALVCRRVYYGETTCSQQYLIRVYSPKSPLFFFFFFFREGIKVYKRVSWGMHIWYSGNFEYCCKGECRVPGNAFKTSNASNKTCSNRKKGTTTTSSFLCINLGDPSVQLLSEWQMLYCHFRPPQDWQQWWNLLGKKKLSKDLRMFLLIFNNDCNFNHKNHLSSHPATSRVLLSSQIELSQVSR